MVERNSRVFCVVNPARKHHRRVWKLVQDHCAALGFPPPQLLTTSVEQPGGAQAAEALERGGDLVIVAGGDGTVRNVGNELAHSSIAMGIIPTGTANIFHLNAIGKEKRLDQSVRTALMGANITVDTGMVKLQLHNGSIFEQRFLVVVGVGRDAMSLGGVSDRLKKFTGPAAYFAAGLAHLARKPLPMTVTIDGQSMEHGVAWSVLVGNCGVVPGGITILPGASLIDGKLNLLHIAPKMILGWVPVAWRSIRGSDRSVRGLIDREADQVTIIPEIPTLVQVDGDVWSDIVRIEIAVDPDSLIIRGKATSSYESPENSGGDPVADSRLDR